jgi:hypothetical protein
MEGEFVKVKVETERQDADCNCFGWELESARRKRN